MPWRYQFHVLRNDDEARYKRCLANSPNFPNITRDEMFECTHKQTDGQERMLYNFNTIMEEKKRQYLMWAEYF